MEVENFADVVCDDIEETIFVRESVKVVFPILDTWNETSVELIGVVVFVSTIVLTTVSLPDNFDDIKETEVMVSIELASVKDIELIEELDSVEDVVTIVGLACVEEVS